MVKDRGVIKSDIKRTDLDPIDWAIVAVVLGGASLLLSLEAKFEARKRYEETRTSAKAMKSNKLYLKKCRVHITEIR